MTVMTEQSTRPSAGAALRGLLESPRLEFLMEAHDGVSARIVEEAGFAGIWASGLSISAQLGVRDSNEASWTQVLEVVEFMADAARVPILLDGDTGYGNFNNLRRLVRKLEQRGIGGVCVEDKVFPKTNSFIAGERQPLADIDEFCGKIRAGADARNDPDFCIIARVEALIAGWGLEAALERAEAYRRAGADAILIHSKSRRPEQVLEFAREWDNRAPLVIVPTKYYSTPTEVFRRAGISVVIWANHMIRAAVANMQRIAREVAVSETLINVEDQVAPVAEIFRLQGADELEAAERRYAAPAKRRGNAIVLSAARGEGLEAVTRDRPKSMLAVAGKPLLQRLVETLKQEQMHDISVVVGYKSEAVDVSGIRAVENPDYDDSGELASLACASDRIGDDTLILYGDLLFRTYILRDLLDAPGEVVAVVDSGPHPQNRPRPRDPAWCTVPDDHGLFRQDVELVHVGTARTSDGSPEREPDGRWIGMLRVCGEGRQWVARALSELEKRPDFQRLGMPDLINHLIAMGCPIKAEYISGHWLDVNDMEDLRRAGDFAHGRPL